MKRLAFLLLPVLPTLPIAAMFGPVAWAGAPAYPAVSSGQQLAFPRDYGAHSRYRTEWWYVTGWLQTDSGAALGFQVTFFRSRPPLDDADPSRFAPTQLLFADAALSDPRVGRLQHDQRAARSGFGLAEASEADTDVYIDDWSLRRDTDGRYRVSIAAADFTFQFTLRPAHPVLLNGAAGYSRKGPIPDEASYYYSEPWLQVDGILTGSDTPGAPGADPTDRPRHVHGHAWLDHEWSSAMLADGAVGWDWIGIDLDDGGGLMAFQIRDKAGHKFWAGGTLRDASGSTRVLAPESVGFVPLRWWRSPHTGTRYPVAMRVDAGDLHLTLKPLMDDQEVDSRLSTGTVYWEGAVFASHAPDNTNPAGTTSESSAAKPLGHGYLELTGYFQRLDL